MLTFIATAVNRQHKLLKQSKSLSSCKWHPKRWTIRFANCEHEQKQLKPKGIRFPRIEMYWMPKETDGEIGKRKDRQPETSQKGKRVMGETHNKNCSEGSSLRREQTNKLFF